MPLDVDVTAVPAGAGLGPLAPAWGELEAAGAADAHPGLTAAWVAAWTRAHRPEALLGVRVAEDGRTVAAGLLEQRRGRRWAFAGAPVTTRRGLIAAPADEPRAWAAFARWLREHPGRFTEVELEGSAPGLVGGRPWTASQPAFALDLPASLDALLAARSRNTRQQLRKKRRRFAEAGGTVRRAGTADRRAALHRLVALHGERAAERGEVHESVDGRLAALLEDVAASGAVGVHVFEAVHGDAVVASAVRLDHAGTGHLLQLGLDPAAAALAPGMCVVLALVEDAAERGVRRLELGPGDFRYKRDIGGVERPHWRVIVPSRSAAGVALRGARELAARLRRG